MKINSIVKFNKIKYKIIEFIGEGGYKKAFLTKNLKNNKNYVIFIQKTNTKKGINIFNGEINKLKHILKKFKNKCVESIICPVFLREIKENSNKKGVIITNYFQGIDLHKFLYKKNTPDYTLIDLFKIFKNLTFVISKLHKTGIVHMDIKPENIMIDPKTFDVNLIDLGVSCDINSKDCEMAGTPLYLPPEYYTKNYEAGIQNFEFDVWALGNIFFQLLTKEHPVEKLILKRFYDKQFNTILYFMKTTNNEKFYKQLKKVEFNDLIKEELKYEAYPEIKEYTIIVKKFLDITLKCLNMDPSKRITIEEILKELDDLEKYLNKFEDLSEDPFILLDFNI
jgi:serine/threonine protein kinase